MTKICLATFRLVIAIGLIILIAPVPMLVPAGSAWFAPAIIAAYAVLTMASTIAAYKNRGVKFAQIEALATVTIIVLLAVLYLPQYGTPQIILIFSSWAAVVVLNYLAFRKLANSTV